MSAELLAVDALQKSVGLAEYASRDERKGQRILRLHDAVGILLRLGQVQAFVGIVAGRVVAIALVLVEKLVELFKLTPFGSRLRQAVAQLTDAVRAQLFIVVALLEAGIEFVEPFPYTSVCCMERQGAYGQ